MKAAVDHADFKILSRLRKNARETLTRVSRDTGIPISSVFDRLKRLETNGVIIRHSSLVDTEKIGTSVRAILLIKTRDKDTKELEKCLSASPPVNNLLKINGELSLMVEAWFKDMKAFEEFVEMLREQFKGIAFSVHHVLEDLKRESFWFDQV
jgi:DNA-binding Lrp family transcriptional regulator